jgi:DNA-binding MarR family transcriptional regulator
VSARKPSPDLRETARDLSSGSIHLLRGLRRVDKQSGVTAARLSALSVLVYGGPTPLGRLARLEGVASPTMTRIVDGLVGLGLACRAAHPDTDRVVVVAATAAGLELMRAAAERRLEVIVEALDQLPDSDREALRAAAPPLRRLAAIIAERQADP